MTITITGSSALFSAHDTVDFKSFTFSAGEEQVRVGDISGYTELTLWSEITDSRSLVELVMTLNAISNADRGNLAPESLKVNVVIPYLPYSRQDRVCYPGEAFGLAGLVNMLSSGMLEDHKWNVTTWDAHSKVAGECFKDLGIGFQNIEVDFFISRFANRGLFEGTLEDLVIVAPDKGAVTRANLAAKTLGVTDVVYGEKVRDPENGEILGLLLKRELPDGTVSTNSEDLALEGKKILIVDDICDGGRTFIELAKSLSSYHVDTIDLYVTHGIFSKGFSVFEDNLGQSLINRFFVPNVFPGVTPPPETFANLYTLQ